MRKRVAGPTSKQKIAERDHKRKRDSGQYVNKQLVTQTANKRANGVSAPHRRPDQKSLAKQKRKVSAPHSDEKKFRHMQLLYDVKRLQKSESMIVPKAPFRRLVREIATELSDEQLRWQQSALNALQYAAQDFMTQIFNDAYACTEHGKRVTLMSKDLALARRIRGPRDPSNW